MTVYHPFRLDQDGTDWVLHCDGEPPVRFPNAARHQANAAFQLVNRAYHLGQQDTAKRLRDILKL